MDEENQIIAININEVISDDDQFNKKLETELTQYTIKNTINDNTNIHKENTNIINQFLTSKTGNYSPLIMSAANSECSTDTDDNSETAIIVKNNNEKQINHVKYNKLSFTDVEHSINKHYNQDKMIGTMDTLVAHIKCQTILYVEAKNLTQKRLNILMIPSLIIATLITVMTPYITTYSNGSYIITAMNALTTMLLTLINHLKLETYTKNYEQIAMRYEKILSSLELFSTKIIYGSETSNFKTIVEAKFKEIEDKILEIKEQNDMLLPEDVKAKFPVISNINIFSTINAIEMHRKTLITRLRSVKNEIRYIYAKWESPLYNPKERENEEKQLVILREKKDQLKEELLQHYNAFSYINEIFEKELGKKDKLNQNWWWRCWFCNNYSNHLNNESIHKHIKLIKFV